MLRLDNPGLCDNLLLNYNLNSHNFSLMSSLETEARLQVNSSKSHYETVYSIKGKIFGRIHKANGAENSIHIKKPSCFDPLISELDSN